MLKENVPYDGLFFDIHGAMSVEGLDDPEGDLIVRIREVVGKKTIISTSMDLHGNVSWRLAQNADLITCYRLAPHEDAIESKKQALENLLNRLESGKGKPSYKAWIPVPILLPGEKTSTRIEPGRSLYAKTEVVVKIGSVNVIVTKKRKLYPREIDFTRLGLNPRETDIVIVKIGYLVPELYNMRADWIMALTPGGVDQDIEHLNYKRIIRPRDVKLMYTDCKLYLQLFSGYRKHRIIYAI